MQSQTSHVSNVISAYNRVRKHMPKSLGADCASDYCVGHADQTAVIDYWDQRAANAAADSGEDGNTIQDELTIAIMMLAESCASVQNGSETVQSVCNQSVNHGEISANASAILIASYYD
jgi:hypothetical protein